MPSRLTALEAKWDAVIPTLATKADIAGMEGSLKSEIKDGAIGTQRWMIATVLSLFLGFGGLFLAMSNSSKGSTTAQPTIIVVPSTAAAQAAAPAASRP